MAGKSRGKDSGKLKIGDDWNAIRIIALSQSNPLKAIAEFVENSIDAHAKSIVITRGKEHHGHYLSVKDDGDGVPRNPEGLPDFKYVATHICDSIKRHLKLDGHGAGLQGEFGIGLLSFWTAFGKGNKSKAKTAAARSGLPKHFKRIIEPLSPAECSSPDCGGSLRDLDNDESEVLEVVPVTFTVKRYVRVGEAAADARRSSRPQLSRGRRSKFLHRGPGKPAEVTSGAMCVTSGRGDRGCPAGVVSVLAGLERRTPAATPPRLSRLASCR
jgi:Histidine kinase-, DNA gyrase B-, and HSP90-like ATPase